MKLKCHSCGVVEKAEQGQSPNVFGLIVKLPWRVWILSGVPLKECIKVFCSRGCEANDKQLKKQTGECHVCMITKKVKPRK